MADIQKIHIAAVAGNATPVLREALAKLPAGTGARVTFDGTATYAFYPEGTEEHEFWPSNNDGGIKHIVFPLIGKKNLEIDGCGATFLFHGRISPFVIADCENVTVRNCIIDYTSTGYCQGKVLRSDDLSFDLELDREEFPYRVTEDGVVYFRREYDETSSVDNVPLVQEYDAEVTGPAYNQGCMFLTTGKTKVDLAKLPVPTLRTAASEAGENILHFENTEPNVKKHRFGVGNILVIKYENRENPAFFLLDSRNITLENITMYRAIGMGVIAETTENVTLDGIRAMTKPGRTGLVAILDDATHFVNCSGKVTIRNCVFEHMMDDAVNIHGIYARVGEIRGDHLTAVLQHGQQKGVNVWKPGDTADLMRFGTLEPLAEMKVVSSEVSDDKTKVYLTFDRPVPDSVEAGDLIENSGRMPEVLITGCRMGHNRPRGILVTTTKRAVIENNVFYNSQTGVHVGGDCTYWFESGRVSDLVIRNNRFLDCCYNGGDYVITVYPEYDRRDGFYFHGNITVENNEFDSFWPGMVYANSVAHLTVRGNRWRRTDTFKPRSDARLTNLAEFCGEVTDEDNVYGYEIKAEHP